MIVGGGLHPVLLNDVRRYLHQLGLVVNHGAVFTEAIAGFLVADDKSDFLEDFEGLLVDGADLVVVEGS